MAGEHAEYARAHDVVGTADTVADVVEGALTQKFFPTPPPAVIGKNKIN